MLFLHWSPVAYWAPTDLGSSSLSFLSFCLFHTVHGILKPSILKWFSIAFSSGPRFVRTLHHDPSILGGPTWHGLCFVELDKAVVHVSVWLVFCDCGFHSVCPLMEKDRGLWKLPNGRDWLRGKLGLVLMDRAMLSKSFIQFSVEGQDCVPSVCLMWGQTMVEVMKIMATSFKRSHALLHSVPLTLQQATANQHLCRRLLDTHRQVWVSLLWGHCSFLLGPGVHKILFVPSKSLFPQSSVSSGGSVVELMVASSKRAYAIPRSAAPRSPALVAGHCWPVPLQEILKHRSGSVSVGYLVPGVHKICLSSPSISGRYGVWF